MFLEDVLRSSYRAELLVSQLDGHEQKSSWGAKVCGLSVIACSISEFG